MTPLPDTGLLRHDRARVIVRPQGHLIRPDAPQPAAITHVLDGIEPKEPNLPLLHRMQQLLQSSKSAPRALIRISGCHFSAADSVLLGLHCFTHCSMSPLVAGFCLDAVSDDIRGDFPPSFLI